MKHLSLIRPQVWLGYVTFHAAAIGYLLMLTQCSDKVEVTRTYRYLEPVYTTTDEIRNSFEVAPPEELSTTGKIYYLAPYVFINKPGEGIHVLDNTDPANPINLSFINIPGNFDMAAQGNILYADSYIDLLAIDISNLDDVQITKRVENVFPRFTTWSGFAASEGSILTDWEEKEVVEVLEGELDEFAPGLYHYRSGIVTEQWVNFATVDSRVLANTNSGGSTAQPQAGIGGSMARFTISSERLYAVDDNNLQVFDITQIDDPIEGNELVVGFGIETIFPYKDKLFIGSQAGMFIYNNTDPDNPEYEGEFIHARACDPVVANDTVAYVTLRDGNDCWGANNQLDVIDVENVSSPQLIQSYSMDHPHGLAIDGTTLFICEGEFGLKVFDASNSREISQNQLVHIEDIHAFDVIPLDGVLMVIGDDGLYQYDYTDPANLQLLSKMTLVAL
ncbi:LVIVD repeat-containing protein [Tunicatimonas pelagia]|uniref:LVIVD repeat-containing protein n=1 Tax=Tunicatimonas pelagia TaxID=931531 RepID=UPI0026663C42|nr:hypothetical protein [Tunicatimonas pelagia]WKN43421.1 hypothetical protein P0M28_00355 [Tunicatimonas pelagia]